MEDCLHFDRFMFLLSEKRYFYILTRTCFSSNWFDDVCEIDAFYIIGCVFICFLPDVHNVFCDQETQFQVFTDC